MIWRSLVAIHQCRVYSYRPSRKPINRARNISRETLLDHDPETERIIKLVLYHSFDREQRVYCTGTAKS